MATDDDQDFDPTDRPPVTRGEMRAVALEMLEAGAKDLEICEALGIHRVTFWRWFRNDPVGREKAAASRRVAVDQLISEAKRRALNGSDSLMIFMLKNLAADQFTDRSKIQHEGAVSLAVVTGVEAPTIDDHDLI
jgi:hypothetical protein